MPRSEANVTEQDRPRHPRAETIRIHPLGPHTQCGTTHYHPVIRVEHSERDGDGSTRQDGAGIRALAGWLWPPVISLITANSIK